MPLGSLLGPLEALLGGLWTSKTLNKTIFLLFLEMQLFGSLKLLMSLLGASWPLIGPIWSQNGLQNCPKVVPFLDLLWNNFGSQNGRQNVPKFRPRIINFGVHFWIFFFEVLELFGCLLGAFLGLLKLSGETSGPQKPRKA